MAREHRYRLEVAWTGNHGSGTSAYRSYDRAHEIRAIFTGTTCGERCDGVDNDRDGKTDEGFLGS